ncbi:hypothetical protein GJAV_G00120030 [Gymnothorax javanicus]|nr:hypothetical protein GJAV_G00120030 [Gymnothorax javanicus]
MSALAFAAIFALRVMRGGTSSGIPRIPRVTASSPWRRKRLSSVHHFDITLGEQSAQRAADRADCPVKCTLDMKGIRETLYTIKERTGLGVKLAAQAPDLQTHPAVPAVAPAALPSSPSAGTAPCAGNGDEKHPPRQPAKTLLVGFIRL